MPTWNQLLSEFETYEEQRRGPWLLEQLEQQLQALVELRGSNVLAYASGFLQKPAAEFATLSITHEDLNGFMPSIHGMDWNRPLTLLLHTPGGDAGAAEAIVSYLRDKFRRIEVVVPALAMSAGTMIALGSDALVMGRQSQLGPIDPQIYVPALGRYVAAGSVVDQFRQAKDDIDENSGRAHLWAPITQTLGYGFLQDAENALLYARDMVGRWLSTYSLRRHDAPKSALDIAAWFADGNQHKSHGARIDRYAARDQGLVISDLEEPQALQEIVLTVYHLLTIVFEQTPATKAIISTDGRRWVKQLTSR